MPADLEAEGHVRRTLNSYCESFDRGDFEKFASLFERGQWFMVDAPGAEAVLTWLRTNIVLHDGETLTRHDISNLDVEVVDDHGVAQFRCHVAIWQILPARPPRLMVLGRWAGEFRLVDDTWWWSSHTAVVDYSGDLSQHIKGFAAA
jgi:hypothetical protein